MNNKVLYIPEGLANWQTLIPSLNFNQIEEWFIVAKDVNNVAVATTRSNSIGCCCGSQKIRIHFVNSVGEIDSINFSQVEETEDVKSDSWTKTLPTTFDRTVGGSYRHNIRSNEIIEAETSCYDENQQYWIKELFETSKAWIELDLPNGFNNSVSKEYVPIEILDSKLPIRKKEKRYEYLVKVKFAMSNANINLR